jgi:hypothetical protein
MGSRVAVRRRSHVVPASGGELVRFYSTPRIVIHVPYYPTDVGHMDTVFRRVEQVMAAGGFITYDLG